MDVFAKTTTRSIFYNAL